MSILLGTNGTIKEIKEIYTDVNGEVHKIIEGYVGVGGVPKCFYKGGPVPGDIWLITYSCNWTPPVTGRYNIELHGGGGGGAGAWIYDGAFNGGGGGGSGELYTNQILTAGVPQRVVIGRGGSGGAAWRESEDPNQNKNNYGGAGGETSFGMLSVSGGEGGHDTFGGLGSGSLASDGNQGGYDSGTGGSGGATRGSYGTGGNGGYGDTQENGTWGKPGCVIVTYIGD